MTPEQHKALQLFEQFKLISRDSYFQREIAHAVSSLKNSEYENCLVYFDMAFLAIERVPHSSREAVRFLRQALVKLAENSTQNVLQSKQDAILALG